MATADPRHAYVRFYLAAVDDLDRVIAALAGTHGAARDAVRAYEDVLRDVPGAGSLAPAAVLSTSALWRPRDPAQLASLTDVYEVVGRFSFQGDDDANLRAMTALVASLRAEVTAAVSLAEMNVAVSSSLDAVYPAPAQPLLHDVNATMPLLMTSPVAPPRAPATPPPSPYDASAARDATVRLARDDASKDWATYRALQIALAVVIVVIVVTVLALLLRR
jgi:hypothetical protein